MRTGKIEMVAGGVILATLAGATIAGLQYRNRMKIYNRKFDPDAVEEFKGRVEEMLYSGGENGEDKGVELILRSGDELLSVHMGPAWYIKHQPEHFKVGDKVVVRGSKIMHNHDQIIIAEWVKKGDLTFRLRQENGHPAWSAWSKN